MRVELGCAKTDAASCAAHFLQSPFWARFKSHHGWTPYRFTVKVTDSCFGGFTTELSVLVRTFARFFSVAYVPLGIEFPFDVLTDESSKMNDAESASAGGIQNESALLQAEGMRLREYVLLLKEATRKMRAFLPRNTVFVRFDPPLCYTKTFSRDTFIQTLKGSGVKKAESDIQPPDTVLLDVTRSSDELLSAMKPKWRYNIRLAQKKGVVVKKCGKEAIDTFYALYEETAKRDGIALHEKSYYTDLFDTALESDSQNEVSLYVAEYEQTPIAAIITLFTKNEAVYLYGASSNEHRNVMPAYLLQWTAIEDARAYGSRRYDFYGIPPTDDEHHPMHGLYRFKTGFGGAIVHRVGSIDVPLSVLYTPYTFAEKLRLVWFKKIKKLLVRVKRSNA